MNKYTPSFACAALLVASCVFGTVPSERPDARTRTIVSPQRIVAMSDGLKDSAALCGPRYGQVSEGAFLAGSGPVLGKGGWIMLDFGREIHGSVQIGSGARSGRAAKVHIRLGESVSEAMSTLGQKGAGNDHAIRDDVIALPWYGRREFGESGFRFVRIDNAGDDPVQLEYVRAVSLMRPMRQLGTFRSSDARLNQVFDTAVRTVHLCCQDFLWDGIKRDRLVWMGDTHPETMSILAVFGDASVLPESLTYMAETTSPNGWMDGMPTYTLWWIRNLAEWYRYTGDLDYLKKYADYLAKTFDHVCGGMQNGEWRSGNFLDWPTNHNGPAAWAGTQALALMTAREVVFLAEALKDKALGGKARALAARLEKLRPDPHGAKSAAALLSLSGLRDPKEMYREVLGQNGHKGVSTFYGYYMIEAISAAGEQKRALDTVRDYWGGMLDMGATSFWEDFNLDWTKNAFRIDEMPVAGQKDVHGDYGEFCYTGFRHSLCHGWSSGPASWCITRVLGIRPTGVGCKTFEVKPDLGDLAWAEGSYALPGGRALKVRAERRADGSVKTTVDAPDGVVVKK